MKSIYWSVFFCGVLAACKAIHTPQSSRVSEGFESLCSPEYIERFVELTAKDTSVFSIQPSICLPQGQRDQAYGLEDNAVSDERSQKTLVKGLALIVDLSSEERQLNALKLTKSQYESINWRVVYISQPRTYEDISTAIQTGLAGASFPYIDIVIHGHGRLRFHDQRHVIRGTKESLSTEEMISTALTALDKAAINTNVIVSSCMSGAIHKTSICNQPYQNRFNTLITSDSGEGQISWDHPKYIDESGKVIEGTVPREQVLEEWMRMRLSPESFDLDEDRRLSLDEFVKAADVPGFEIWVTTAEISAKRSPNASGGWKYDRKEKDVEDVPARKTEVKTERDPHNPSKFIEKTKYIFSQSPKVVNPSSIILTLD